MEIHYKEYDLKRLDDLIDRVDVTYTVVIEEGVEYIATYAFANCTALQSITIPASVTMMDGGVTYGSSAKIYYYEGTYADQYFHSKAAKLVKEELVSLGEFVPAE